MKSVLSLCRPTAIALGLVLTCAGDDRQEIDVAFSKEVVPFLREYCTDCHQGEDPDANLALDRFEYSANVNTEFETWERVRRMVVERQMPPSDASQPDQADVLKFIEAIDRQLDSLECESEKHPGRVTIRRLNRVEYNNTIGDLFGLDLHIADSFPSDDVGDGFDNIGEVLSISPILMEKYVDAARTIAEKVFEDDRAKKTVIVETAKSDNERVEVARRNLRQLTTRVFRRPISDSHLDRLFELMVVAFRSGASENEIYQTVLTASLASPEFLFRIETDPEGDDTVRQLDDYELASRLSYFLWSSTPDDELLEAAGRGELSNREGLVRQTQRMLGDPKSQALVDHFAGQWLQLRDVDLFKPNPDQFQQFDQSLRQAMRRETELLFENVLQENRSVVEFLNADYTFVNERLANHYGIAGVRGDKFERVSTGPGRRGVLTHASILMLTSNPTRTNPVKRGKWILENILGEAPPPPPPDVPELEEEGEALGSLRERMEVHRTKESCAVCHRKMDALGLGLENFDVVGGWRDRDGRFEIDPSGELPGGRKFKNPSELMVLLAEEKKLEFCRCLTEKMLTYALGRGLDAYDRCTVKEIVKRLEENEFRFQTIITEIVQSNPFRLREAPREE